MAGQAASVPVTVRITKQVDFGESLKLVGNQPCLGNWDLSKADHLRWTDGHVWSSTFNAPVGVEIRFKLVRTKDNGEPVWEDGSDRKFKPFLIP
ncbi:CBM20 domain-containing protein [Haematococcus lacustris]|uniref:CBM20 domain-containing protein n=1 Tax=Haematococcus lacustris TaxID=44745 RepID=A0A699Z7A7_HAELA|nr:CBM20 domain-containing protein [Haematococcus lacustris]